MSLLEKFKEGAICIFVVGITYGGLILLKVSDFVLGYVTAFVTCWTARILNEFYSKNK